MDSKLRGPTGPAKMKPERTILCTGTVTSSVLSHPQLLRIVLSNIATHIQQTWIYKAGRGEGDKNQTARACKLGTTLIFLIHILKYC